MTFMQYLSTTVYRYYFNRLLTIVGIKTQAAIFLDVDFRDPRTLSSVDFRNPRTLSDADFRNPRTLTDGDFRNPKTLSNGGFRNPKTLTDVDFVTETEIA